jgi:hypothetical protein
VTDKTFTELLRCANEALAHAKGKRMNSALMASVSVPIRRIRRFVAAVAGCCLVLGLALAMIGASASAAQRAALKAATPTDPTVGIIEAFHSHSVVALGEGDHGNAPGHAFRLALIRDPRFLASVNDIVVEFGNALYQETMDRFVNGEDVPYGALRKVWENTTQPFTTFDNTMYRDFFEAVRSVNQPLSRERRLRVLLGDPPIDWDVIHNRDESRRWLAERDPFPVGLIRREVLAKNRRALVVYGGMHLQRQNFSFNYSDADSRNLTIVGALEHLAPPAKVFSIWTNTAVDLNELQDVNSWPIPSLTSVRGTPFGAADFTFYYRLADERFAFRGTELLPIPHQDWQHRTMTDQFDAILYLGPAQSITQVPLPRELCGDDYYMKMRTERLLLVGLPMQVTRLKEFCASPQ